MTRKILRVAYIALILLFMYAPIFTLTLYSFVDVNAVSVEDLFNIGFSFSLYEKLFTDAALMKIVLDTLLLALIVATLATILGTAGAIGVYGVGEFEGRKR